MNHAVGPAGDHGVGVAAADDHRRLPDGLGAGRTRRQHVERRPADAELRRQVGQHHVGLLLLLAVDVHPREGKLAPADGVE